MSNRYLEKHYQRYLVQFQVLVFSFAAQFPTFEFKMVRLWVTTYLIMVRSKAVAVYSWTSTVLSAPFSVSYGLCSIHELQDKKCFFSSYSAPSPLCSWRFHFRLSVSLYRSSHGVSHDGFFFSFFFQKVDSKVVFFIGYYSSNTIIHGDCSMK